MEMVREKEESTEGLSDRQVGLDDGQWGTGHWLFIDDYTSSLGKARVDTTDGVRWAGDINHVHWLLQSWGSSHFGSIIGSSGSWDDLTTTTMDSITVEGNIEDVESDSTHGFLSQNGFLGNPLEGGFHRVSDFVEVLDGLGGIDQYVWSLVVWPEDPQLLGFHGVPAEFVDQLSDSGLGLILRSQVASFDFLGEFLRHGLSAAVQSVVLVRALGHADLVALLGNSFLV